MNGLGFIIIILLDERLGVEPVNLKVLQNVHELLRLVAMRGGKERLNTGWICKSFGNSGQKVEVLALK